MTDDSPLAHPEWLALVAAMRFNPDDDTPRLIGADWLTETSRPELIAWGEFIRYQCEGAREKRSHKFTDSCDCKPCGCERKATAIYDRWGMHWAFNVWTGCDIVPTSPPVGQYMRGFALFAISTGRIVKLGLLAESVPPAFARSPLTTLMLHFDHTHPMRQADRYILGVMAKPSPIIPGRLTVTARLTSAHRLAVAVDRHRPAATAAQFTRAIGGAIRHAFKDRSALFV